MEPAILRVAQAVEAQTATGFAIRDMIARALAEHEKSDRRSELRLADIQLALDQFGAGLEEVPRSLQVMIGPIVDARRALESGTKNLRDAVEHISQEFPLQPREPGELDAETPRHLQIFVLWITRIGWKHRVRLGVAFVGAATPWLARWPEIWAGIKFLLTGGSL